MLPYAFGLVLTTGLVLQSPFITPYPMEEMAGKQAVVETTMGQFVIDLTPDLAPNHVGHFMKLAAEGAFVGTTFHRVIRYGIIQGGDPLTTDPARADEYGTGGLNRLDAEFSDAPLTAGAVAAVLVPGDPDSAGTQFFVCATDQLALNGQYTVFGRVLEGLEVVQAISAVEASDDGRPIERVTIEAVTIRDAPPRPFVNDTVEELSQYHVTLDTSLGTIELELLPRLAPETVRQFLVLTAAGFYDGMLVHRVAPGFVVQAGTVGFRETPLTASQNALVTNLAPEFTDTPVAPGIVSLAHGDDPASGTTSFFICVGQCRTLDGQYATFARVTSGMDIAMRMTEVALDGETPREPIVIRRAAVDTSERQVTNP